jgi:hypothetical protein
MLPAYIMQPMYLLNFFYFLWMVELINANEALSFVNKWN